MLELGERGAPYRMTGGQLGYLALPLGRQGQQVFTTDQGMAFGRQPDRQYSPPARKRPATPRINYAATIR
jgi:hypothetical protein